MGASISYIFDVLAFTSQFNVLEWAVFAAQFLAVMVGFEQFIEWSMTLE